MNITSVQNASGFGELAVWTNNATQGILFNGGLWIFFIVLFLIFKSKGEDVAVCLSASSWLVFVLSGLFWWGSLVSSLTPVLFLVIASISTFVLYATSSPY